MCVGEYSFQTYFYSYLVEGKFLIFRFVIFNILTTFHHLYNRSNECPNIRKFSQPPGMIIILPKLKIIKHSWSEFSLSFQIKV